MKRLVITITMLFALSPIFALYYESNILMQKYGVVDNLCDGYVLEVSNNVDTYKIGYHIQFKTNDLDD